MFVLSLPLVSARLKLGCPMIASTAKGAMGAKNCSCWSLRYLRVLRGKTGLPDDRINREERDEREGTYCCCLFAALAFFAVRMVFDGVCGTTPVLAQAAMRALRVPHDH